MSWWWLVVVFLATWFVRGMLSVIYLEGLTLRLAAVMDSLDPDGTPMTHSDLLQAVREHAPHCTRLKLRVACRRLERAGFINHAGHVPAGQREWYR